MAAAPSNTLRCANCLENKALVRILKCKHEICDSCCKTCYFDVDELGEANEIHANRGRIICPVDKKFTVLANGIDSNKDLPKRFAVDLQCETCSKSHPLQNHWWCSDCHEAVCSWCAMQNHRSHDCSPFQDGKVIQECLQFLEAFSKYSLNSTEKEIDDFCDLLSKELKSRLQGLVEIESAADSIKHIFELNLNTVAANDDSYKQIEKLDKKLQLVNIIMSSIDRKFAFDVQRAIKQSAGQRLRFPQVEMIADLFFENLNDENKTEASICVAVNSEKRNTPEVVLDSDNKSVVARDQVPIQHETLETQVSTTSESKSTELSWELFLRGAFQNPSNICAIPNVGVVVLDNYGVHLLSQKLEHRKKVGWPATMRTSVIPSVAYHPGRKSILILRETKNNYHEDATKIIEREIPSLTRLSAISYPDFIDNENRLLGVMKSGRLVCATSSAIWIKLIDIQKSQGVIVWRRSAAEKLESFSKFVVGPSMNDTTEVLYIFGTKTVYIFAYNQRNETLRIAESCQLVLQIANNGAFPYIICRKNIVRISNRDRAELKDITYNRAPVKPIKIQPLTDDNFLNKSVVMCSDDNYAYLLSCEGNTLYSGCFIDF